MPYADIPGTKAAYIDRGALSVVSRSIQPNVLVIGPASSGTNLKRFNIVQTSLAEREFGVASPVMRAAHELLAQRADNISILRAGGHPGQLVITDSATKTLTITTAYADDEVLARYALRVTTESGVNRYVVFDLDKRTYVYDSLRILSADDGIVYITDSGWAVGAVINDTAIPALWISLADLATGDVDVSGASVTITDVTAFAGSDGVSGSLIERYAALAQAYLHLDYKDADYLVPVDVYADDKNIVDIDDAVSSKTGNPATLTDYGFFWSGPPVGGSARDVLGYAWQFIYRGQAYLAFADQSDFFSLSQTAATVAGGGVAIPASLSGKGGNANTFAIVDGGALAATAVTITLNSDGGYDVVLSADISGPVTKATAVTAVNAAIAAATHTSVGAHSTRVLLPSEVFGTATVNGGAGNIAVSAKSNFTGGVGGAGVVIAPNPYLSLPAEVSTRLGAATDAQLREVNFAHQLADACYVASTHWKDMLGAINFREPVRSDGISPPSRSFPPNGIWIGDLPEVVDNGTDKYIASSGDNGEGVLGFKFLAGQYGYRGQRLQTVSSTNGLAGGGFIRTIGSALPNGEDWPYGIDHDDEALDESGRPVDLGKHIFVCYDWPLLINGFNGGTRYYGALAATFIGKLLVTRVQDEPIGQNGTVVRGTVGDALKLHSTQVSQLASVRAIGLRFDETANSWIFTTAKTAAHPSSDYTRCSTIRVANNLIAGIRRIAAPYIGKPYTSQVLVSLKSSIDQFLVATLAEGKHNKAKARLTYSAADRILGRLTVELAFVPPFTIEQIVVKTSLAADESDL